MFTAAVNLLLLLVCLHAAEGVPSPPDSKPLTAKDLRNGRRMKERPRPKGKAKGQESVDRLFEGDIDLDNKPLSFYMTSFPTVADLIQMKKDPMGQPQRNAVRDSSYRWADGKVPYVVSSRFNSYERGRIAAAIEGYKEETCIEWVEHSGESDYVYFVKEGGCWSYVGRRGGQQKVSIGSGCEYKGIIQHEMMHALGFFHEQSRNDRDQYIRIEWANVLSGRENNFQSYSLDRITHLGTAYDYNSVMHYGDTSFSKNGQPTIVALRGGAENMGQREGLSDNDVTKLNKMYCNGGGGGGQVFCTDQYSVCPYFQSWCSLIASVCCATCSSSNDKGGNENGNGGDAISSILEKGNSFIEKLTGSNPFAGSLPSNPFTSGSLPTIPFPSGANPLDQLKSLLTGRRKRR